jgi:hypothetical protein
MSLTLYIKEKEEKIPKKGDIFALKPLRENEERGQNHADIR